MQPASTSAVQAKRTSKLSAKRSNAREGARFGVGARSGFAGRAGGGLQAPSNKSWLRSRVNASSRRLDRLRADRQHGTRRVPHDLLGDAPDQQVREPGAPVRRHDDEIDAL